MKSIDLTKKPDVRDAINQEFRAMVASMIRSHAALTRLVYGKIDAPNLLELGDEASAMVHLVSDLDTIIRGVIAIPACGLTPEIISKSTMPAPYHVQHQLDGTAFPIAGAGIVDLGPAAKPFTHPPAYPEPSREIKFGAPHTVQGSTFPELTPTK